MESLVQGSRIGKDSLNFLIYGRYKSDQPDVTFPYTPAWIKYDVGFIHPVTNQFMNIGSRNRLPNFLDTGKFQPNFIVGDDWKPGIYEVRWHYRVTESSVTNMTSVQFSIVASGMAQPQLVMENHVDIRAYLILD